MARRIRAIALAGLLLVVTAGAAGAGSFHFRSSSFTLGSLTFNASAVGLGNDAYTIVLQGTATVTANCVNKGGGQAQGRNDLNVSVSNTTTVTTDANGQAPVNLTVENPTLADFPSAPSKKDAGCPNGNWTVENVTFVGWTGAHITVTETASGEIVFDQAYSCGTTSGTFGCSPV